MKNNFFCSYYVCYQIVGLLPYLRVVNESLDNLDIIKYIDNLLKPILDMTCVIVSIDTETNPYF